MGKIAEIRLLISDNEIEEAINALMQFSTQHDDQDLQNNLILLKSRYKQVRQRETANVMDSRDVSREQAQITQALLYYVSESEKKYPDTDSKEEVADVENATPSAQRDVILFLASAPSDMAKLQLDKEFVRISQSLQDGLIDYSLKSEFALKPQDLQSAVLKHKPRIVHFSGHGADANTTNKTGGIFLQDDKGEGQLVSGLALANMFSILLRKIGIEVVLLNSCYSEEQAKAIVQSVPYVIGMNDSVKDGVAIEFAAGFYQSISQYPDDIDFAFDLAKNQIELTDLPQEDAPVLFKKPG